MRIINFLSRFFALAVCIIVFASANMPSPKLETGESPWLAPKWADTLSYKGQITESFILSGKALFKANCAVCHGETGRGDGESGFGLEVPPGDFTDAFTLAESDGSIYWKITYGRLPMPDFQIKFSEIQRWQLVAHIRNLQRSHLSRIPKSKHFKK